MDEEQYKIILQKTWLQMGNGERKKGGCVREGGVGGEGLHGRGWLQAAWAGLTLRGNRLRVDMAVATLGETPSLTQDRKWARDEQASCIVPSLAPLPQAVWQRSKEGCLAPGEYLKPRPITTYQLHQDKEIRLK